MVQYKPRQALPTQDDLPETDFAPVDSELQVLVPSLLAEILAWYWRDRSDWFWGINMGVYYEPKQPAIVPDGFLSLGVDHFNREDGRQSYVLWEEGKPPLLALEYVSRTYGQEYDAKMAAYANIGVLYYVIYNPIFFHLRQRKPLEIYKLEDGKYVLQDGEPIWLPEIGLGLGQEKGTYRNCFREWLYWYNEQGERLTVTAEVAEQAKQRAEQERQRAEQEASRAAKADQRAEEASLRAEKEKELREQLLDKLRKKGIDPDML